MSWLMETMIATTLLMVLVLAVRRPVANLFGPRIAYLLWLAPALRMIMPPLPAEWFGNAASTETHLPLLAETLIPIAPGPVAEASAPVFAAPMDWVGLGLAFWIAGAVIFFVGHAFAYADFSRRAQRRATGLMDAEGIPVIASALVPSPVALGLFTRTILVPVDFLWRYDAAERRLALAHELVHHRRYDLLANVAGLAILSIHWWNPVAHFAFRAFRLDQEAACDAVVLSTSNADDRRAYGNALYKSAAGTMPLAVCALGSASQLKARLRLIARGSCNAMPLRGVALALLGVGAGVVMTASTISVAAPADTSPAMLALGGVEIDTGDVDAELGRLEAEAGDLEAAAAQIEANAADRMTRARADADDIATRAGADAADAATRTRADAEDSATRIAAEAADTEARSQADAARQSAESARQAADVVRAKARKAIATAGKCRDGTRMSAQVIDKGRDTMRIVLCGKVIHDQAKVRDEVVAGLREARNDIARERDMPESIRATVLASLDRSLAQWRRGVPMIPVPSAPPAAPRAPDGAEPPAPPAPPEIANACPTGTRNTHVMSHNHNGRSITKVICDGRSVAAMSRR
jgi:bla regulator protein blaR1